MSNIEKSVTESAAVVEKLGHNSQQINQIVETIAAIADQTNLLALNAAIEGLIAEQSSSTEEIAASSRAPADVAVTLQDEIKV